MPPPTYATNIAYNKYQIKQITLNLFLDSQAAPYVPVVYGVDAAGCVSGPSGKVCPTGNIQYLN